MRNLKKAVAVFLTAAMTMSASVMAFAGETVTLHFENAKNWEPVGAHVYEGVGFTTNVTPVDKAFVVSKNDDGTDKVVWPGAKMEKEFGNWYKITVTFEDATNNGIAVIFNNGVGDTEPNDVGFSQADADAVKASGIPTTGKDQTGNVTLGKKAIAKLGGMPSDLYITYDGKATGDPTNVEPDSYKAAKDAASAPADNNGGSASGDNNANASSNNSGTATNNNTSTNSGSKTTAPKTGDAVAVSVVMIGLLATVAFVASKKRVND